MASQFKMLDRLKRRQNPPTEVGQRAGWSPSIANAVHLLRCPRCGAQPGQRLHVENNVVSCQACGAVMLELPEPGPDWIERYTTYTANPVTLALVESWMPPHSHDAALVLVGWLGSRLREQYSRVN